mgnify:CR=1 FL=1
MRTTTALLVGLLSALPVQAAVHRSSDFGWTEDQDITEAFAKLLQDGLSAGRLLTEEQDDLLTQIRVALRSGGRVSAPGVSVLRRRDSGLAPYGNGSRDRREHAVAGLQGGF